MLYRKSISNNILPKLFFNIIIILTYFLSVTPYQLWTMPPGALSRQEVEERLRNLTPIEARLNLACLGGEGAQHVFCSLILEDASFTLKSLTRLGALNAIAGISNEAASRIMAGMSPTMALLTLQATTPAVCCSCGRATPAITLTTATPEEGETGQMI